MMNRRTLVVALWVLAGAVVAPGAARADDNRFAVATIRNDTKDVTIHFEYRWGNGEWKKVTGLKPGQSEWVSYTLDAAGKAPKLQMRINEAVGNAQTVDKVFDLKWKAAPDKGVKFGHQYSIQRDKSDNDYVSVYDAE
jgi:hypothetical protein